MNTMTLLGIDIGKHSFHLHGQDAKGHQVLRKKTNRGQLLSTLARLPACTVVMESCGGAHWLARQVGALGHEVKLIASQNVKPFVKGNKSDFINAEAICEAASRPAMHFCSIKTAEQQTLLALHRVRDSLIGHRTVATNQIHGFLLEFGISSPIGATALHRVPALLDDAQHTVPLCLKGVVMRLHHQIQLLNDEIKDIESDLKQQLKDDAGSRLRSIPGIGPITASAVLADVGVELSKWTRFCRFARAGAEAIFDGRKDSATGDQQARDKHIRQLLVQGARSMQHIDKREDALGPWVRELLTRRHSNVVACALANKLARIVWAVLAKGGQYAPHPNA